jgi:hypothetical protein
MNNLHLRKLTGVILILTPLVTIVFFTLLQITFEYPDILRAPPIRFTSSGRRQAHCPVVRPDVWQLFVPDLML